MITLLDRRYYSSREFADLSEADKVAIILENAEDIFRIEHPRSCISDGQQTYLVTIYLRSDCGCPKSVLDELSGETIQIDTHDRGCLRERFPICEDVSDASLFRRRHRESLRDHAGLTILEETSFA